MNRPPLELRAGCAPTSQVYETRASLSTLTEQMVAATLAHHGIAFPREDGRLYRTRTG